MPKNVEIKARLADSERAQHTARQISGSDPEVIHQHDIFFATRSGRLKLRMFPDGSGELIAYHRQDTADIRTSSYRMARTADARVLREILAKLGATTVGEVRKHRLLYLVGQTRVHLDRVEGLGDFLEFEVVLRDGQSESSGAVIARDLMAAFGIDHNDLIAGAYVDLLT